jgi:N-acylneuraminate cytidylyltransferase
MTDISNNILAIITARSGSKGVPRKNVKPLNGLPLTFYTIDVARSMFNDTDICLTTDDIELIDLAKKERNFDVPFIRPSLLASDEASTYDVLLHAIANYESLGKFYETIVLLQPTSPLRTAQHLKEAIKLFKSEQVDMVVSVKEAKSNPYFTLFEENEEGLLGLSKQSNYTRRQDCPKVYEYNGAIYVIRVESLKKSVLSQFKKIKKYIMDDKASIDIDTPLDWKIAELILHNKL